MGQGQAKTGPSFACTPTPPPPDLNKACGNAMDAHEAAQMHQNFSQQLLQDHIEACSLPEHNLITVRAQGRGGRMRVLGGSLGPAHATCSPGDALPEKGSTPLATVSLRLSNKP